MAVSLPSLLPNLAAIEVDMSPSQANVFISVPSYGAMVPQAIEGLMLATSDHRYVIKAQGGSLLAYNFNRLWCIALNSREECGWTHFAMHHADIEAQPGWVDKLIAEMNRVGVDLLSVVVPIKDPRGLTSTGLMDPKSRRIKRLTMKEIAKLPRTFTAADTTEPDNILVVNTGLWVCDFTKPWVEEVHFQILDGIQKNDNGKFSPLIFSEDWNFSAKLQELGLKVAATNIVEVNHYGHGHYSNQGAWGDWESDQGDPF